jgi:hypothetical protein
MSRDGTALLAIAVALALLSVAGPSSARKLVPVEAPQAVPIEVSGNVYDYFPLTPDRPLTLEIEGPAVFRAILRWRFQESSAPVDVDVRITVDGASTWHHIFRARAGRWRYPGRPVTVAGRSERFEMDLRSGRHVITMGLAAPGEGTLDVNPLAIEPSTLPWRVEWRGEFGATYDSNIFRYSDADVEDFLDGLRGDRYTSDTVDDLRLEPGARLHFVRERPGQRSTRVSLGADWRLATVNGEKSFAKLSVGVREERDGVAYLRAAYAAIPSYHIRRLWDADAEEEDSEYRSCDFRKHEVRLEAGSDRSLPVDVAGFLEWERYGYDPDFVEYDADATTVGVLATVRPASGLRLDLGYALRRLKARGYDQIGESRLTSDDSDTTYDQDEYELRLRWEAGKWWGRRAVVYLRSTLRKRFYLTDKSGADDPYHAGREDTYWTVGASARLTLTEAAALEAFVEHRGRSADSAFVEDIDERKDYTALRTGLRLRLEGVRFLD